MRIIFTTIGQLLAAIPAMLGFVPTRSIVYVLLRAGIVTVSARVDAHGASTIAPRIAELAGETYSDSVIVVAVSPEVEAYDQAGIAGAMLHDRGVPAHVYAVSAIGEGAPWRNLITGERGLTEDYQSNAFTAAVAVELGQHIAASRDEMANDYATTDPVAMAPAQRAAGNGAQFAADVAAEVVGVATGEVAATDELAARFGYLITTQIVARDAILWLLRDDPLTAAGNLAPLAAPLRGEHRAQALTVIVALYAMAGRGAQANTGVEAVEREGLTKPSMLVLIDRMLRVGATPQLLGDALAGAMDDDSAAAALGGYRR